VPLQVTQAVKLVTVPHMRYNCMNLLETAAKPYVLLRIEVILFLTLGRHNFVSTICKLLLMVLHNVKLYGVPQNQLLYWGRLPLQVALIAWAWWYTKHPKQPQVKA